jgi:hypothetical protein
MYINHNLSHNIYYKITEIRHVISKVLIVQLYLNILKLGQVGFRVVWFRVISDFRSFGFGSGRVSSHLISGRPRFWIVQRISGRLGFQVRFRFRSGQFLCTMLSDSLGFWIVLGRIGSGSGQFDFFKKSD